jgi:type II secretory pathway component PulF
MLSGSDVAMRSAIAKRLTQVHRGQVRRRSLRFLELSNQGVRFDEAIRRSKLVREPHERWLVGLIMRFGDLQETQKIIACKSPWFECIQRLSERANALKWMSVVFTVSLGYLAILQLGFIFPMMSRTLNEFEMGDSDAARLVREDAILSHETSYLLYLEISDPLTSLFGVSLLCLLISPVLLVFLLQTCRPFHTLFISWWMRPVYRAWTLRGIGEALSTDRNLVKVMRASSEIHPVRKIQKQLSTLATNLENGMNIQGAFVQSRLIRRSQRSLLALAKEPQQLAWTVRQIAERNFHRWIEWYSIWIDLLSIAIILSMALSVGYLAYIVFKVLASMILLFPFT